MYKGFPKSDNQDTHQLDEPDSSQPLRRYFTHKEERSLSLYTPIIFFSIN